MHEAGSEERDFSLQSCRAVPVNAALKQSYISVSLMPAKYSGVTRCSPKGKALNVRLKLKGKLQKKTFENGKAVLVSDSGKCREFFQLWRW